MAIPSGLSLLGYLPVSETPPSEPGVQLSLHRALQRLTFLPSVTVAVSSPFRFRRHRSHFRSLRLPFYSANVNLLASLSLCVAFPCAEYADAADASQPASSALLPCRCEVSLVHDPGICKVVWVAVIRQPSPSLGLPGIGRVNRWSAGPL